MKLKQYMVALGLLVVGGWHGHAVLGAAMVGVRLDERRSHAPKLAITATTTCPRCMQRGHATRR